MDHIDTLSFLCTSFAVAYLTDITGIALVFCQACWFAALWIGKKYIDRWLAGQH